MRAASELNAAPTAERRRSEKPASSCRRLPTTPGGRCDKAAFPPYALAREVLASGKEGETAIVTMVRELGLHSLRTVSRGRI
ncbi:MAG: hypothetical protein KKG92_03865, partial [Gammaproteobacteria bacterium]|nr:hypothetical protein [Gammaproteobacteria bacterium]